VVIATEGGVIQSIVAENPAWVRIVEVDYTPDAQPRKLDPTVDRSRFRRQRDHLKAAGYQFRPLDQIWTLSHPEEVKK